jgi:hypothetical protein
MGSQLNAGQQMQTEGPGAALGVSATDFGMAQARFIAAMEPRLQPLAVANIRATYGAELADLVVQALATMGVSVQETGAPAGAPLGTPLDTRPLPEQRAPRRETASV